MTNVLICSDYFVFVLWFRFLAAFFQNHNPISGSGAVRLTEDVWHQKYGNKKVFFQSNLKYWFNRISNIIPHSRYRDLNLAKNRIHNIVIWTAGTGTGTGTGTFSRLYFTNTNTKYIFYKIIIYQWIFFMGTLHGYRERHGKY